MSSIANCQRPKNTLSLTTFGIGGVNLLEVLLVASKHGRGLGVPSRTY